MQRGTWLKLRTWPSSYRSRWNNNNRLKREAGIKTMHVPKRWLTTFWPPECKLEDSDFYLEWSIQAKGSVDPVQPQTDMRGGSHLIVYWTNFFDKLHRRWLVRWKLTKPQPTREKKVGGGIWKYKQINWGQQTIKWFLLSLSLSFQILSYQIKFWIGPFYPSSLSWHNISPSDIGVPSYPRFSKSCPTILVSITTSLDDRWVCWTSLSLSLFLDTMFSV